MRRFALTLVILSALLAKAHGSTTERASYTLPGQFQRNWDTATITWAPPPTASPTGHWLYIVTSQLKTEQPMIFDEVVDETSTTQDFYDQQDGHWTIYAVPINFTD